MKKLLLITLMFISKNVISQTILSPWVGYNRVKINYKDAYNLNNNIELPKQDHSYSFGTYVNIPINKKNFFFTTGIMYSKNKINFQLVSELAGINPKESVLKWKYSYSQISLPILLYKSFYFNKTKTSNISLYSGISLALSFQDQFSYDATIVSEKTDLVSFGINGFLNEKNVLVISYNGGVDIAPFQNFRNLKFGINFLMNLNESTAFIGQGEFINHTKNTSQKDVTTAKPTFYNFIFNIKYDINFKKREKIKFKKFENEIDY